MPSATIPLTAPFAVVGSRRSTRTPLAVVFASGGETRDELLLDIDPATGRCQAEYFSHAFEGEGTGEATMRRLNDHTFVVIAQLTVRGLDQGTEECRSVRFDVAVTWSLDPVLETIDVAGTALVLGSDPGEIAQLGAVVGHSFNRFDPSFDGAFGSDAEVAA